MARPETLKQAVQPSPLHALIAQTQLSPSHLPNLHALALQVQHNLQFQHSWTALRVHTHSPLTNEPLPRPLLAGLPPKRLYVHPDEQIALLKTAERTRKARKRAGDSSDALEIKAAPEREWILPTRLSEKWTLRRLSDVFAGTSLVPPEAEESETVTDRPANPWRSTKRVVLATVSPDSTVVYYIVQDGVVKPRQN
ncbi:tRNA-splicing endonuclease subunit Sen15 [Lophiotrema nucula]|uniref:tRNA-splicing endonuclease subunit Sen15 n=1 Tax=Lophiotrema nucula TaxID=690887 RepID=A0A6A5ZHX2_9PLEO|nr:tRNA-splicing endonuclease subunit Sen15 [Lophiotrema nucula]